MIVHILDSTESPSNHFKYLKNDVDSPTISFYSEVWEVHLMTYCTSSGRMLAVTHSAPIVMNLFRHKNRKI